MCKSVFKLLGGLFAGGMGRPQTTQQAETVQTPVGDTGAAATTAAQTRKRAMSLLSAAGAVGDTSGAITSTGGAAGKTAIGA